MLSMRIDDSAFTKELKPWHEHFPGESTHPQYEKGEPLAFLLLRQTQRSPVADLASFEGIFETIHSHHPDLVIP